MAKWFSLRGDPGESEEELARDFNHAHAIFAGVVDRNVVPAYPIFLLSVLQALENGTPVDADASAYGYFYELLVRTSLVETSDSVAYEVKSAYLAFLAHRMFTEDLEEPSYDDLRRIHEDYIDEYKLRLPLERLLDSLTQAKILQASGDGYRFKYKYAFYYFVATYLKDHISEPEVHALISTMSQEIHVEKNANVFLFLAYLIKDPYVITELLSAAQELYSTYSPAKFDDEIRFFHDSGALESLRFLDQDTSSARRNIMETADVVRREVEKRQEVDQKDDIGDAYSDDSRRLEYAAAIKTLQILGQIVKSYPGSLRGDIKLAVTRECYMLGLRVVRNFLETIRERQARMIDSYIEIARANGDVGSDQELLTRAKRAVFNFTQVMSSSLIKVTADAVGTRLLEEVHKQIVQENPSNAVLLVDLSMKLDHQSQFPDREIKTLYNQLKSNFPALAVLRFLVIDHFLRYQRDFTTKQRTCDLLEIPYERIRVGSTNLRPIGN